jgi:predicted transcriptional regulator
MEDLLGPLEQEVMEVVWDLEDATVRDVYERLAARRKIAYTTVMTTMSRLATKGYLRRDTDALAHRYRPAISRDAYGHSTVASVLGWLMDRYPEPAASYLADIVGDVDDTALERLRETVQRRRREER